MRSQRFVLRTGRKDDRRRSRSGGTHRELRVKQICARREPLLLQPTGFAMCERLVENIRQCRPGPEGLRLAQQSSRALDVTREGRATGLLYERLEPVEVELVRTDCE